MGKGCSMRNIKSYTGKGRKNKSINMDFINICKLSADELKKYLEIVLRKYYDNVFSEDGFLYAKGDDKIVLTAHMDTVHKENIKDYHEYIENFMHYVSSPQGIGGDDRCGIYMILEILKRTDYRPYIVFCEDEEIGCVGSRKFTTTNHIYDLADCYFMIELDRRGNNDIVFYDDINSDFHYNVAIVTGYNEEWGSCSDISYLAPAAGISAVNISCGYHNEHTTDEYVVLEEMENSILATIKLMEDGFANAIQYEYMEDTRYAFGYDLGNNSYDEDVNLYVLYKRKDGNMDEVIVYGRDENAAFMEFFISHPDVSWNDIQDYDVWEESANDYRSKFLSDRYKYVEGFAI